MSKLIFVVDDNDSNLTLAAMTLEDDYRVLTMPSGAKMLALLEKKQPDLILLDVEMPDMNGLEAIAMLKADSRFAPIPVVFLTGLEGEALATFKERALAAGACDTVAKPFESQTLLSAVDKYICVGGAV